MKVKDIREGKVDQIELDIVEVGEERSVRGKFGSSRVCDAVGQDETGRVKITLWNDEIDRVRGAPRVRITNGWAKEWNRELQISAGRYGRIEVIE
jgi:replication factor A1